jgi:hypothetical protein
VQLARRQASQIEAEKRQLLLKLQTQISEEEQGLALAEQELIALQRPLFP